MAGVLSAAFEALAAHGPHPDHHDELMLFGQFVGSWDLDVTWYEAGSPVRREKGEWHFAWVLEGRAVQDIWIVPPRIERGSRTDLYEYGSSMRFYDPALGAWRSTWIGPMRGGVILFIARGIGDEIVLEGRDAEDERPMRWVFSEIAPDRFLWRNTVSADAGQTWTTQQDFTCRRVA